MGWFSGALGGLAAGGIGGAIVGGLSGLSEEHDAHKQMKYQNKMNISNWNMQNEYNSPVAQMQRLRAANLNPMLVYGSGNVTGNSTSSIGSADMPSAGSSSSGAKVGGAYFKRMQSKLAENNVRGSTEDVTGKSLDNQMKQLKLDILKHRFNSLTAGGSSGNATSSEKPYDEKKELDLILKRARVKDIMDEKQHPVLKSMSDIPWYGKFIDAGSSLFESGFDKVIPWWHRYDGKDIGDIESMWN